MNPHSLNMKSEIDRRKTFNYWRVPYKDLNQLAAASFSLQTESMWFVVRFVEWKAGIGLKEMMHLRTISAGVHLAGLLMGCL
jgi:hypothetical protein